MSKHLFRRRTNAPESPLKDRPLRYPGQSLDQRLDTLINDDLAVVILIPLVLWWVSGYEWYAQLKGVPRMPGAYAALALVATVCAAIRIWGMKEQIRTLKLGRDGERAVGQFLEQKRNEGARVFHDVIADGFNIDHVVISPQGVFVIETKTWMKRSSRSEIGVRDGRTFKDGRQLNPNPLDQAIATAAWLSRQLSESTAKKVSAWPVVLFPGWFVQPMDDATRQKGWVLSAKALPVFLEKEPARLAEQDVAMFAFHLSRMIRTEQK
jgi:hypothetical protein